MATIVGHYPWFLVFNALNADLPNVESTVESAQLVVSALSFNTGLNSGEILELLVSKIILFPDIRFLELSRSAFIGVAASCTSDICSNSLRVLKTSKQTAEENTNSSYIQITKQILATDGLQGLFGRGLQVSSSQAVSNVLIVVLNLTLLSYV